MSHTLDRLLPLVSPGDSLVLIHIVDESVEDMIAGEMVDADEVFTYFRSISADERCKSPKIGGTTQYWLCSRCCFPAWGERQ